MVLNGKELWPQALVSLPPKVSENLSLLKSLEDIENFIRENQQ